MLTDCPIGWGHEPRLFAQVIDGAVDCLFWPLYEVVEGRYELTYAPPSVLQVADWLALQGRFAHLLEPENEPVVAGIQEQIERDWLALLERCGDRLAPSPTRPSGWLPRAARA